MDINAPDFAESFKRENAVVGIVGQGFVGGAVKAFFDKHKFPVIAHDKFKSGYSKLEDVVRKADIIFVCVPTPMRQNGECYTGIPEEVFADIDRLAQEVGRPGDTFVLCLKSTVPPGFTDRMKEMYPLLRITFSPEFLTEKTAIQDMLNATRVVCGGNPDDANVILRYFLEADRERVVERKCALVACPPRVAEMAKLYTNGMLFTKVLFCNEIQQLCLKMGISYEDVRLVSSLDQRLGNSHTSVPGHDGFLGAGGHCFPKDMNNLKFLANQYVTGERLFTAVLERNAEVREEKDWEKMSDRAVTTK
jgi:UDPglucose 6-dehydrogenase